MLEVHIIYTKLVRHHIPQAKVAEVGIKQILTSLLKQIAQRSKLFNDLQSLTAFYHRAILKRYKSKEKQIAKIQAAWKSYTTRQELLSQGYKLPDRSKLKPLTQEEEIKLLKATVKSLQSQVSELTSIKNQHEEALSYLFEQVKNLRNKTK